MVIKEVKAKIIDIVNETHNVKAIKLKILEDFEFKPGQYCMIILNETQKPFSIASSPGKKRYIEFVIKEVGEFTRKIFNLKKDDVIKIKGPLGKEIKFDKDLAFIVAGSGITPLLSAINFMQDKNLKNNVFAIYSNRTKEDIIHEDKLNELSKNDNFKIVYTLTRENKEGYEFGHITKNMILKHVENPKDFLWHVYGSPEMIGDVRTILKELELEVF
ncbi:FAD-dependent oxidoreductase [archaeon]|nr:FAD-dependent oxidoreductase [archaeon]